MKRTLTRALFFWATGSLAFNAYAGTVNKREPFDHAHSKWTAVLSRNVVEVSQESGVKYGTLKSDAGDLDAYVRTLEKVSKFEFDQFTQPQKLAFLINAYNAFTIKLVIDNYPIASIKNAGSIFNGPWKKKFFSLFGQKRSLGEIEHEMIRPVFNEPRIHLHLYARRQVARLFDGRRSAPRNLRRNWMIPQRNFWAIQTKIAI